MKWFEGDIASAISLAKNRGSIFTVYCEGKDEYSKQMTDLIQHESIASKLESERFVAIRLFSDKEEYMMFAKIYQVVPVPSIFFIKNGIPLKIVSSTTKTVEELEEAINSVLNNESSQTESSTSSTAGSSNKTEVICEDGVCYKKPSETETEQEKQEKIKKAMKLIEEKRIERIKEEQRLEKEREIQRRKEGQQIVDLKKIKEDQEMKQFKEDRMKDKQDAKAARQRVLDQIEQDKKERAQRFGTSTKQTEPKVSPTTPPVTTPTTQAANTSRIQFKKPDGDTEVVTFDSDMIFSDLHLFVKNDILHGSVKDFTLAMSFPRREYSQVDFDKTLTELNLTPSAVLLILVGKKSTFSPGKSSNVLPTQTDGSMTSMLYALFTGLFSPVVALFSYVRNYFSRPPITGESPNEAGKRKRNEDLLAANDAAKKRNLSAFNSSQSADASSSKKSSPTGTIPKSSAYKRPANNVHRLHQNSDSDEEKKTYNGNSTQQM